MADEQLDLEQIIPAMEAAGVTPDCPSCGRRGYKISEPLWLSALDAKGIIRVTDGIEVFAVVCSNCGDVRLFDLEVVQGKA